jgi:hypothetical protein
MADDAKGTALPPPLIPAHCELRDLPSIMLHRSIVTSHLAMMSTGDEFKAAIILYEAAYDQTPAGSLPKDERALAFLSRAATNWPKVRDMALRGWTECSDHRLYHPLTAEKVLIAWIGRLKQRIAAKAGGAKKNNTGGFDAGPLLRQIDEALACLARVAPESKELERWRRHRPVQPDGGEVVHLRGGEAAA